MTPNRPAEWQRNGSEAQAHEDGPTSRPSLTGFVPRLGVVHRIERAAGAASLAICGTRVDATVRITDDVGMVTCEACRANDQWRCATCSGAWTNGVLLLGGRFHPTCEPRPRETTDAREMWDG